MATMTPVRRDPPPEVRDRPRPVGARTLDDRLALFGSAAGSGTLTWICFDRLLPFSGAVGFLVCWYLGFLVLYGVVTAMAHPRPALVDRLVAAIVHGGAAVVFGAVITTICYVLWKGHYALFHVNFVTHDMKGVSPTAPLTEGGVLHAITGTLIEIGIAVLIALPLGVGTAVFISEVGGRFARLVRTVVEAMTALPDILAGLFIYTSLIAFFHFPVSGFAAGLALSIMGLPIIARSSEVVLRVVPGGLREASLALGASRWSTVRKVVLPTARAGLATSLILGIARMVGETAPVYLTSSASTFFSANPYGPMNSLPLYIFSAFVTGQRQDSARLWGAASVLLLVVLILFITARVLASSRASRS
ncbi:MAG TPA: phosphate ABC transporter permease PstA [Streptosporangiaceae bacterium]